MATEAQPVKKLEEHIRALEATIAVCVAEPTKRAVHKLRSTTRRIEAQLTLLGRLQGLPPFRTEAAVVRRHLRRLRRAAGKVRDLDVHNDLLNEFFRPSRPHTVHARELHDDAEKLRADQLERREHAAARLTKTLTGHQADIAGALEDLRKALKPALTLKLPATELLELVERDFRKLAGLDEPGSARPKKRKRAASHRRRLQDDEFLHELRKTAKSVRYMAEAAPQSRRAAALARDYEALQESGGQWHDWLELARDAKSLLGPKHALTKLFKERRDRHHTGFLTALAHRGVR